MFIYRQPNSQRGARRVVRVVGPGAAVHPRHGQRRAAARGHGACRSAAVRPIVRTGAAAYSYNKKDDKITTSFAIDRRLGVLVLQGSMQGVAPVVSPITGQLRSVGSLGLGELTDATFDIADIPGDAFAAVRTAQSPTSRLHLINLTHRACHV